MAHLVDVIFLDIDGVLLPFGGSRDHYHKKDHPCTIEGCIFPDHAMEALTELLQRIRTITFTINGGMLNSTTKNKNNSSTDATAAGLVIHGKPVLVLSSTWRARSEFIRDILSSFCAYAEGMQLEIIWETHMDSFFDICDPNHHASRHEEIYRWVRSNVTTRGKCIQQFNNKATKKKYIVRSWIALDDEDIVNVEGRVVQDAMQHAVRTKSSVGLTLQDVELGVRLVEKQIRDFHGIPPSPST